MSGSAARLTPYKPQSAVRVINLDTGRTILPKTANRKLYYDAENHFATDNEATFRAATRAVQLHGQAPAPKAAARRKSNKRSRVPPAVKLVVWQTHCGDNIHGTCYCCQRPVTCFDCNYGHIMAHAHGGSASADNLRPVCPSCNLSMGKINMHDFIRAHGLPGPKRITPEHTNQGPIIKLIKREEGRLKIVTTNPTPTTRVA